MATHRGIGWFESSMIVYFIGHIFCSRGPTIDRVMRKGDRCSYKNNISPKQPSKTAFMVLLTELMILQNLIFMWIYWQISWSYRIYSSCLWLYWQSSWFCRLNSSFLLHGSSDRAHDLAESTIHVNFMALLAELMILQTLLFMWIYRQSSWSCRIYSSCESTDRAHDLAESTHYVNLLTELMILQNLLFTWIYWQNSWSCRIYSLSSWLYWQSP